MHIDQGPGHFDQVTTVQSFFFASRGENGVLEAEQVRVEELVLLARAEEALLDEHDENLGHARKIALCHAEEAGVKSCHDVVKEHLDILRVVSGHRLHKLGELSWRESSNIDAFLSEAFQGLLNESLAVLFVFKEVHHVD